MDDPDPSVIETVVVTGEELVTALEARERATERTALRVTAPYSGRMRARLHVAQGDENEDPAQVLLPPERVVDDACPAPPHPDDTADALRDDPDAEYSVDRHHDRHGEALDAWRETVLGHVTDRAVLSSGHEVEIAVLTADGPGSAD